MGILIIVRQITCYGNDRFGRMSGRDIMTLAVDYMKVVNLTIGKNELKNVNI